MSCGVRCGKRLAHRDGAASTPARTLRKMSDHSRSTASLFEQRAPLARRLQLGQVSLRRRKPRALLGRPGERDGAW